ncbi:MAG: TIGR00159 family protein, partial [Porcipelethomonas sp.]
MYAVKNMLDMVWNVIQSITFMDIIDILLMSYLVYLLIKLIRETRAGQLVKGILFIVIAYVISNLIGLKAMSYIIKSALDIGLLAILIMFQPEIRRALEKAGRSKIGITLFSVGETADQSAKWNTCIEAICD